MVRFEGRKDVLLRELHKCALRGWSLQRDADKIQAALDRAAAREKTRQILTQSRGGKA